MVDPNQVLQALLYQYAQVCEDIRHRDSMVWQMPTAATLIDGTLLTMGLTSIEDHLIGCLVISIAFIGTIVLTVNVHKNIFYRWSSFYDLMKIEESLMKYGAFIIPRTTKQVMGVIELRRKDLPSSDRWISEKNWWCNQPAHKWLRYYMYLLLYIHIIAITVKFSLQYVPLNYLTFALIVFVESTILGVIYSAYINQDSVMSQSKKR